MQLVKSGNAVFCLAHNHTGYPMVRPGRAVVKSGTIGAVRMVHSEYVQAGMASAVECGALTPKPKWKLNAARSVRVHVHVRLRVHVCYAGRNSAPLKESYLICHRNERAFEFSPTLKRR